MNQGPSGGMPRSDSETNGQARVGSGSSTSDKPVRRTTSESAGLLDATEEFIANLKRKTTVSSSASASTNSSDAMDVLNQLLFAHTSSLSSTASKSFSGDESPPSSSSHQIKETEFRQDISCMNPPVIVSDDSRSPSEPPNNDDHQRSNSKGKDSRVLEDHPPRPPPPRRIDPGMTYLIGHRQICTVPSAHRTIAVEGGTIAGTIGMIGTAGTIMIGMMSGMMIATTHGTMNVTTETAITSSTLLHRNACLCLHPLPQDRGTRELHYPANFLTVQ